MASTNKAGSRRSQEGVVNRPVSGHPLVLVPHVFEVLRVPTERTEHRVDQRYLRVLLTDVLAAVTRDLLSYLAEHVVEIGSRAFRLGR